MKLLTTLVLVLSLAACKKESPPTTPGNSGGDDTPSGDPYACSANEDCVAVELACCDACNGGEAVGVHKDHVDAVLADSPQGKGECEGAMCTKMGCAPWVATCDGGKCAIARGSL